MLDDLNPEELSDRVGLGDDLVSCRSRVSGGLRTIDEAFIEIIGYKTTFASDVDAVAYLDGLVVELKAAMYNIYMKY